MTVQPSQPVPNPGVLDIEIYVPGKSKAPDGVKLTKLSSNETPLGASAAARDAFLRAGAHLHDYPDGMASDLRAAIASVHGLNAGNIVCGNGSDELLALLASTYLGQGDEAIYSRHGFLVYRINILAAGATPVIAGEVDETASVDAILARVTPATKMVFLANPNNPTGTYLPMSEVRRLHAGLPGHVILVLDAAYAEYVQRNDYEAGIELVSASSNVVMTRTFSKIYGLAALRVGWLYGPAGIVEALHRVRGPFNVNAPAIAAASAAIADRDHTARAVAHNLEWLARTSEALQAIGLRVTPSVGNFILIHFPEDEALNAAAADEVLTRHGYLLRRVTSYGFPNALRMTIGDREANEGVIALLSRFMGAAQ